MNLDTAINSSITAATAGYEIYEAEEMLDAISRTQIHLERLGLSWHHPRMIAYLDRVSRSLNRPISSRHFLPLSAYKNLADRLEALNVEDV